MPAINAPTTLPFSSNSSTTVDGTQTATVFVMYNENNNKSNTLAAVRAAATDTTERSRFRTRSKAPLSPSSPLSLSLPFAFCCCCCCFAGVARFVIILTSIVALANCNTISESKTTATDDDYSSSSSPSLHHPLEPNGLQKFTTASGSSSLKSREATFDDVLMSMSLVVGGDGGRENICDYQCDCSKGKSAFLMVICDYRENRKLNEIFGSNFRIPREASSLVIKLASNTNFRLERGLFENNKINSLTIIGTLNDEEQVEITSEAFEGNAGPYPDIHIVTCFSVIVRAKAFSGNCKFNVSQSNDVILYRNAFESSSVHGYFSGINDLRIEEQAFYRANAKLRIESSNIDNIYRFEASLREIRFVDCTIGTINGGTFDVISINSIVFEECRIGVIKARAITEKLHSEHLAITGAIIGTIESEAISGSGIAELILSRNKIDTIHEYAIHVTAINATIHDNTIKRLGNEWLRVKEWSNITISRNKFGIFGRMLLEKTSQPVVCRFEGNSLTQPLPGSLNMANPYCILRDVSVNVPCNCNKTWLGRFSSRDLRSEVYCTIDEKLQSCFNSTNFNSLQYLHVVCDDRAETLECVKNRNLKRIDGVFFTQEELASRDQKVPKLIFLTAAAVITLVILAIIALITANRCARARAKNNGSQHSSNLASIQPPDHVHEFSLDDRHVIDQTMQMMQKKYPDIYKQVKDRTQTLLQRDIGDKKCVKLISNIVNLLDNCDNSGEDFVAFNGILLQHLQPTLPSAPPVDPIYAEPSTAPVIMDVGGSGGGGGGDGGFYNANATSAILSALPEHIYAEPNCAQQPLLRNEYASPADRNMDSMDLYSEPVHDREHNLILPPFDSGQHQRQLYAVTSLQPSSSQQSPTEPDDLQHQMFNSRSPTSAAAAAATNLTNVQRIAQDLQSMPKFHLTLTPGTNRRHHNNHHHHHHQPHHNLFTVPPPVYSAPNKKMQATLATPEFDECELDMRGATALSPDSGSDHSGGSNETVKIDDIEYADA